MILIQRELRQFRSKSFDFLFVSVIEGVVQLFEGLSDRLLSSLKEVLVERNKLTLGKELGKGQFMVSHEKDPVTVQLWFMVPWLTTGFVD